MISNQFASRPFLSLVDEYMSQDSLRSSLYPPINAEAARGDHACIRFRFDSRDYIIILPCLVILYTIEFLPFGVVFRSDEKVVLLSHIRVYHLQCPYNGQVCGSILVSRRSRLMTM